MTKRSRNYFQRQKELRKGKWLDLLKFPLLPDNFFADMLTKKEVRIPLGHVPEAFIADYRHRSHLDEIATISMQLPAPVVRHMEFLVKAKEMLHEAIGLPPIHFKTDLANGEEE